MNTTKLLPNAVTTLVAIQLGVIASAEGAPKEKKEPNTSFGPIKQIDAGLLSVGYVDIGPTDGRPVILLHGWPYDIHSYAEVATPRLSAALKPSTTQIMLLSRFIITGGG
jgi:hypothetical protein